MDANEPVVNAEKNAPITEEQQKKVDEALEKDKEAYAILEKCINDYNFFYFLACKRHGDQNRTSLLINKNYKLSASMKLFIQMSLIETISSISQDIIAQFSKDNLVVGPMKDFVSKERLAEIIGEKITELEKEGKIQIIPADGEMTDAEAEEILKELKEMKMDAKEASNEPNKQ